MTKDDVIRMAHEAGFVEYELDDGTTNAFDVRYARFANLVAALAAAAEREACAKLVVGLFDPEDAVAEFIAEAILARGNT